MFERDKDDLRSLGIEIEVGSFDPLFNDEAGYRIKQEKYQLDLGEVTALEISLLSLAARAWQGASLDDAAQRALVKLHSLGIAVDDSNLLDSVPAFSDAGLDLPMITRAIAEHQILEFTYRNFDLSEDERRIVPIGLSTRSGLWYFSGVDQSIEEIRTFRFDRVIENFVTIKYLYDNGVDHRTAIAGRHHQLSNADNLCRQLGDLFNAVMNQKENETGRQSKAWVSSIDIVREKLNEFRKKQLKLKLAKKGSSFPVDLNKFEYPIFDSVNTSNKKIKYVPPKFKIGEMVHVLYNEPRKFNRNQNGENVKQNT